MINLDKPAPTAPKANPDEAAYLAACADAEPVLRRVLLAGDPELGRWSLTKAQARRVARMIEQERLDAGSDVQDIERLHSLMQSAPTQADRALAARLLAINDYAREWLRHRWQGRDARWVCNRIATGRDPEAMLELAAGGMIPPMPSAAARHAKSLVPPDTRKTDEQRQRLADIHAEAMG